MAVTLVAVEGVVLVAAGWTCPLTLLAQHLGAARGPVADSFLPTWLAGRIFPICGTAYALALLAIALRRFA